MEEYLKRATIKPLSAYVAIVLELDRLRQLVSDLQYQLQDAQLKIDNAQAFPKTILVYNNRTAINLRLSHIIMMKSDSNYTTIYLSDGTQILTSKTLKYWGEKIKDNADFIRPHRSFIVNKHHIVSYQASLKQLELIGGKVAKVSRTSKF